MTLNELLEQVRALYVKELSASVRRAKKAGTPLHVEPLLRDKRGKVVREGDVKSGVRLDLVVERDGAYEDVRVDSSSRLEFEAIAIPWSDRLNVTIEPFVWDSLVLEANVPAKDAVKLTRPWIDEWMATGSDERPLGKNGLANVVHFAADPEARGGGTLLALDLGSAPAESLLALVDGFAAAGATKVRLASEPSTKSATRATTAKSAKKTSAKSANQKTAKKKTATRL